MQGLNLEGKLKFESKKKRSISHAPLSYENLRIYYKNNTYPFLTRALCFLA
jgi:hypothetical protein